MTLNNEDVAEYVETIMGSQRVTRVDIPTSSGRKRHLSEPDICSTVKKQPRTEGIDMCFKKTNTDKTLNIVIRDLPKSDNEDVESRVNKLLKDGLRIRDVKCEKAERKRSRNPNKPGIIIATMKSHDKKRKVMFEKKSLKSNNQYSNVFIQHDQAPADRVLASNFRSILSTIKSHGLTVRGSRVIPRKSHEDRNRPRDNNSSDSRRSDASPARDQHADNRNHSRDSSDSRDRRDRGGHSNWRDHGYGDHDDGYTTVRDRRERGGRGRGRGRGHSRNRVRC
ncbi:uncharacterized protein LOC128548225 [Mercenaria mercenaria]|uniref:uncharacterized protein LOC128548225 n=1 Tax=Mercenaria mercenaria TaxID=6596 RepID=UPI00234F8A1C|nr:uncharacterized protein LOC128548225 [Mercenaria mercenaria]